MKFLLVLILTLHLGLSNTTVQAQTSSLQVTYGSKGLQELVFDGKKLADLDQWPEDVFHIGHMKAFGASGRVRTDGPYGWGENCQSRSFDLATKTWRYTCAWGTISLRYQQTGDALNFVVTTTNRAGSGISFDGATLFPASLHLPRVPVGFGAPSDSHYLSDIEQPAVITAVFGEDQIVEVAPDAQMPLYVGFQALGKDFVYSAMISSTAPDSSRGESSPGRTIKPGETDTFTVSLRFAATKQPLALLASDAYQDFARRYPAMLHWDDRRMIGTVFLASSPPGNKSEPAGFPTNPRRYFGDANLDINTPEGLQIFQARVLKQARETVANLRRMHAQGAITWDAEGEQYPQDTSYACSPDQISALAPEMESVVSDKDSPWAGKKLDDAYFKIIHDAGFRVGVCVRPQRLVLSDDHTARQVSLPDSEVAANLVYKMRYAHDRWGATIFYLDSTVRADGSTLPAAIIERAAAALPDSLLIPEESSPRMYRSTAAFRTFLFHGDVSTAPEIRLIYPHAFSANLVNDVDPSKLSKQRQELTTAVHDGDILMMLSSYWQENNATAVEIYRQAGLSTASR